MAKLKTEAIVKKNPEQVADVLCSKEFLVSIEKEREEVIDAVYSPVKKTGDTIEFEIAVTGYKHNKKGEMDKSDTRTNIAEYKLNKKEQTLSVLWKGSGRIRIEGLYRLQPEKDGTKLSFEATVEVKIPVIGLIHRRPHK